MAEVDLQGVLDSLSKWLECKVTGFTGLEIMVDISNTTIDKVMKSIDTISVNGKPRFQMMGTNRLIVSLSV
ncbi:MAG: hypothetical protein KGH87_08330 [Thaumarchaeota archaeon]|nr:hypothetical protein [Nitrososphaerota archaeon]